MKRTNKKDLHTDAEDAAPQPCLGGCPMPDIAKLIGGKWKNTLLLTAMA